MNAGPRRREQTVPRMLPPRVVRRTPISSLERHDSGNVLILVVERDPHVRALERYFLEEAGFSVAFAENGEEALAAARANKPDLVITEILVPRLDGLALCREIRNDPALKDTGVLIFSILAAAGRAEEAGASAFIRKPLGEDSLLSAVRNLIAKPETAG
jgi:CheY-like chemotaxis protein